MKRKTVLSFLALILCSALIIFLPLTSHSEKKGKTIIEEWKKIKIPNPPELQKVTINPSETALLILDIQSNLCNKESRPRCLATVPGIKKLLEAARAKGVMVAYSITKTAAPKDILKEVTPNEGESVVQSGVDKFYNTELEKILKDKGIKTVIIVGTMSHGAIMGTSTGASLRGMNVIVPVDGMSADNPYAEQYTAWHLKNSPGTKNNVTLTQLSWINF